MSTEVTAAALAQEAAPATLSPQTGEAAPSHSPPAVPMPNAWARPLAAKDKPKEAGTSEERDISPPAEETAESSDTPVPQHETEPKPKPVNPWSVRRTRPAPAKAATTSGPARQTTTSTQLAAVAAPAPAAVPKAVTPDSALGVENEDAPTEQVLLAEPAVQSWPSLGEATKNNPKSPTEKTMTPLSPQRAKEEAAAAAAAAAEVASGKAKREKWIPFPEAVPVPSRRSEDAHGARQEARGRQRSNGSSTALSAPIQASGSDTANWRSDQQQGGSKRGSGRKTPRGRGASMQGSVRGGANTGPGREAHGKGEPPASRKSTTARHPSSSVGPVAATVVDSVNGSATAGSYNTGSYNGTYPVGFDAYNASNYMYYNYYPAMDEATLKEALKQQIEYYFSVDNLVKDMFLRTKMGPDGFLPLSLICGFKRVKMMSQDMTFILSAIAESEEVEVQDDQIRKRKDWNLFLAPVHSFHVDAPPFIPANKQEPTSSEDPTANPPVSTVTALVGVPATENKDDIKEETKAASPSKTPDGWSQVKPRTKKPAAGVGRLSSAVPIPTSIAVDDELDFDFDEDVLAKPGKTMGGIVEPYKPLSSEEGSDFDDEEVERMLILIQSAEKPKKHEKERTGSYTTRNKMTSEWVDQINTELYYYEMDLVNGDKSGDQISRSASFSKTSVLSERDFALQKRGLTDDARPMAVSPQKVSKSPLAPPAGDVLARSAPIDVPVTPSKRPTTVVAAEPRFFPTPVKTPSAAAAKKVHKSKYGENPVEETSVGWVMGNKKIPRGRANSISNLLSSSPSAAVLGISPVSLAMTPQQHPSRELLTESGFVEHKYHKFHAHCLRDHKAKGPGKSAEMTTLYRFWSFFLQTNFNRHMYHDFFRLALEDACKDEQAARYGLECLFRLFSYGLERKWREHLFRDFQNVALWDYRTGHVYGLEKFWALLKFRKSTHPISYDPELDVALKAFQKLEDFSNPALLPVAVKNAKQLPLPTPRPSGGKPVASHKCAPAKS